MRPFLVAITAVGLALLGGSGLGAAPTVNPQSMGFALTILDRLGPVDDQANTSVAIGVDGRPLISYHDDANSDLKVAHCRNAACRSATTAVLDSAGDVGRWSAIAIGGDGLGLISYYDATNGDLKVAHCSNIACSTATTATIDTVGGPSSITVGTDGRGLIVYEAEGALKTAHCSNVACSTATTATIDIVQGGPHPSIALGSDGRGLISYVDRTENGDFGLSVAHCVDTACSTATTANSLPGFFEMVSSIAIGGDGLGLITVADIDSNLYVAHCSNLDCSTVTFASVGVSLVREAAITVGGEGLGLVSFVQGDGGGLAVARCQDTTCSSATIVPVDPLASPLTSIAVGVDGAPLIAYYDDSDLKAAHCPNSSCSPRR